MKISFYILIIALSIAFFAACGEKNDSEKQKLTSENSDKTVAALKADSARIHDSIMNIGIPSKIDLTKIESTLSTDYSKKPLEGQIICLKDIALENTTQINKEQAKKLFEEGEIIAFKSGENIYLVYNEDGSFAGKKLAGYANNTKVGMVGKCLVVNGFNIFIVKLMEGL